MILQTAVAVLYFINKVLLSLGKKSGWQIGLLASILAIFYFYNLGSILLVGLEISFLSILLFGLLTHQKELKHQEILYGIMIFVMILLFFILKESSWLEFSISLLFILAIFGLAHRWLIIGWILMLCGHLLMGYFTYQKGEFIFASMQFLSAIVALFAIIRIYASGSKL